MPQPNRFVTARLSFRKGTTAEWASANPVLQMSEPAWDTTLNMLKVGDGVTAWSDLSYVQNLGGPDPWINDNSGLYPSFIEKQYDAIDYVKYYLDEFEHTAVDYFQAGIDLDPYDDRFELSVKASTGGAASIVGHNNHWNKYDDGDTVEITAVVFNPYTFDGWTGLLPGETDAATTTITMSETRNLVANFTRV